MVDDAEELHRKQDHVQRLMGEASPHCSAPTPTHIHPSPPLLQHIPTTALGSLRVAASASTRTPPTTSHPRRLLRAPLLQDSCAWTPVPPPPQTG